MRSPWGCVISLAMGSVFSLRSTWYSCLCLPDYSHVPPHQACNLTHFQPYTFTAFCNTFIENDIYVIQFSYLKYILWYLEYWELWSCKNEHFWTFPSSLKDTMFPLAITTSYPNFFHIFDPYWVKFYAWYQV